MAAAGALELITPQWPAPRGLRAVATTRRGGVSTGSFASLNLGDHVGDDPAAVTANRQRLGITLGLSSEPRWLRQVHSGRVVRAEQLGATPEADAIIASTTGLICAVLTADCLPVLLCDETGAHVAAAHAGWRGLAAGILEATVAGLGGAGVAPARLLAWLGPAISSAAYEVGAEVREACLAADPAAAAGFAVNTRGRWQMDLPGLARRRLATLGVHRVYGGELCTHGDPARFFSHRRDGSCGRQAALIWME